MSSQAKLSQRSFFGLIQSSLTGFGLLCAFVASLAVLANDAYYFAHFGFTPSVGLLLIGLLVGCLPAPWGLGAVISLLPLTAGIPNLLNSLLGITVLAMPNPGLDLVAGLFLSTALKLLVNKLGIAKVRVSEKHLWMDISPWPVGLVMVMITTSVTLSIARNIYMSATSTSIKGVQFNLMHFRPIEWRSDYLPIGNWVAYALAVGAIFLVIYNLRKIDLEEKNQWIFRPFMIGLAVSAIAGLIQAVNGWGIPEAQLQFRKDAFGYAAMGMQPDLHAFAAHMLLGVVGLWGYFLACKTRLERYCTVILFVLCSAGLIASKSRASLLMAIATLTIFGLIYFYRLSKKYFVIAFSISILACSIVLVSAESIPGLAWVGDLVTQIQSRRLDSLSDLGGMMGSRFEIWSAVANMFSAYPLMGVGEGEFYRLSSNISFARSEFLQLNQGENAHNYFLQVLAENGLTGIIIFAIAFIIPYRDCKSKNLLLPLEIALLSLYLGNVFAHSFLVRENLLLGAVILGLLYSFALANKDHCLSRNNLLTMKSTFFGVMALLLLLGGMAGEVIASFGKLPFKAGADCFVKDMPSYPDGWTSGAWEELLPRGARTVNLEIESNHSNIEKYPINIRFEILSWEPGKGKVPVASVQYQWASNQTTALHLELPPQYFLSKHVITTRLQLSRCFTPRNLGLSTDGRRLGAIIKNLKYQ